MPQVRRKRASDPAAANGPDRPAPLGDEQETVAPAAPDQRGDRGWRLLRLAAGAVVVAAIGTAIVIAWPIVYSRYVVPVGENTADVSALRSRLVDLETHVDALNDGHAAAAARADEMDERLSEQLAEHHRLLSALEAMDRSLASDDRDAQEEVAREVRLLKAMELMSRARLFLYQSNFGLAEQDLEAARRLLVELDEGTASTDTTALAAAVERLDRTIDALPDFPVVASDDLDIAWRALLGDVPSVTPEPAATPSPTPTATTTPSATDAP